MKKKICLGNVLTYEQSYVSLAHTFQANHQQYESHMKILDVLEENMMLENDGTIVSQETQHTEEIDIQEHSDTAIMFGCFDPKQTTHTYDLALDLGITRKQLDATEILTNEMTYEAYLDLARSLNEKQQQVFFTMFYII